MAKDTLATPPWQALKLVHGIGAVSIWIQWTRSYQDKVEAPSSRNIPTSKAARPMRASGIALKLSRHQNSDLCASLRAKTNIASAATFFSHTCNVPSHPNKARFLQLRPSTVCRACRWPGTVATPTCQPVSIFIVTP